MCLVWSAAAGAAGAPPAASQPASAYARAEAVLSAGDPAGAIRLLEAVPEPDRDLGTLLLLGRAHLDGRNLPEARRCFRAATERGPRSAEAHYWLGRVYLLGERFALAAEALETAEVLGLNSAGLHLSLATAYFRLGNHTGPPAAPRRVLGGVPGRIVQGVYVIEQVPERDGRFHVAGRRSALFHARAALDAEPDNVAARLLLADIWLATRRPGRARAAYAGVEDRVPEEQQADYYHRYAQACLGAEDMGGYLRCFREAAARDAERYGAGLAEAYRRVAERYGAEGDLDNYIRHLELALREAPASAELHYTLGNACFEAGRRQDASRHWRITLELKPGHPDRARMLELVRIITTETGGPPGTGGR